MPRINFALAGVAAVALTAGTAPAAWAVQEPTVTSGPAAAEIAYFAYSLSSGSSQEDIFRIDPHSKHVTRVIDDDVTGRFVSERDPRWSPNRSKLVVFRLSTDPGDVTKLVVIDPVTGANLPGFVQVTVDGQIGGPGAVWVDEQHVLRSDNGTLVRTDMTTGAEVEVASDSVTWWTDPATGNEIPEGWYFDTPAWNPTGGTAVVANHGVRLPDGDGGFYPGVDDTRLVSFTPAQVSTALTSGTPLTLADATTVRTPPDRGLGYGQPDWSPAGDRVVYTILTPVDPTTDYPLQSDVWMTTTGSGAMEDVTPTSADSEYGPVFGPDGDQIAYVMGNEDAWSNIYVLDLDSKKTGTAKAKGKALTNDTVWFRGGLDW